MLDTKKGGSAMLLCGGVRFINDVSGDDGFRSPDCATPEVISEAYPSPMTMETGLDFAGFGSRPRLRSGLSLATVLLDRFVTIRHDGCSGAVPSPPPLPDLLLPDLTGWVHRFP
jgi:hypothetical protein